MSDRRHAVDFDSTYFAQRARAGQLFTPEQAFRHAYETRLWRGAESVSGTGSALPQTQRLRDSLPDLIRRWEVRSLLDLPCGDGHWMAKVPLEGVAYLGADLLPEVIREAKALESAANRQFTVLNLLQDELPPADLLLCRDCLVHFAFDDIWQALARIQRAGVRYLLTTTFPQESANLDIVTGDWRPLNLMAEPFAFPAPLELLEEGCTENAGQFADKSLALWRVADLPAPNEHRITTA